ncbi:PP2C family protein-serine/threonine phosphatase [Roseivivax sediminis]|nr:fused response regulator/phosphatase [Roseivivax sediminis]
MVVDDCAGQRIMLARLLGRWGYEVTEACNAEDALGLLARRPQDIVLSDWMMPGLDGLDLCRRLRGLPDAGYSYFILLTSKCDKAEVARGLDAGADDFLSKPVNANELRARLNAGARVVGMQRELQEKNGVISDTLGKLQQAYDAIDRDLKQARNIQQALVPERTLDRPRGRVSLLFKPCGHVGGDLVGMFSPDEAQIGVYGIDVSGHGITSAMVTARVAGYLNPRYDDQNIGLRRCAGGVHAMQRPDDVVRLLNERFIADPGVDEYFTMAYATVDLAAGLLRLVQAGHPSPLLIRPGGRMQFVGRGGLPVGLLPDAAHETLEMQLEEGDRLLIYSDGMTEAATPDGRMIDDAGLLRIAAACGAASGTEFLDELFWRLAQEVAPESGFQDDVSAALFEYGLSRA